MMYSMTRLAGSNGARSSRPRDLTAILTFCFGDAKGSLLLAQVMVGGVGEHAKRQQADELGTRHPDAARSDALSQASSKAT